MEIHLNDTFQTLTDLIEATKTYTENQTTKFNPPIIKPKLFTQTCIGRKDFQCEAFVQAILRKKDSLWVVKKIKSVHKCPAEIHNLGIENYIISKIDNKNVFLPRIGKMMGELETKGLNVGYNGVFNAYKKLSTNSHLFVNEKTDDNVDIRNLKDTSIESYIEELNIYNKKEWFIKADSYFFFLQFSELKKLCRNVIEIKAIEKNDGWVVYAILYDPHDFPIIYSFLVSDEKDLKESISELLANIDCNYFDFMIEFNKELIEIFESLNIDFLVKTRDICREVYKNEKDRNVIEKLWGICNGYIKRQKGGNTNKRKRKAGDDDTAFYSVECDEESNTVLSGEKFDKIIGLVKNLGPIKEERFIKRTSYFNLNNLECDLDYISSAFYTMGYIECINGILVSLKTSESSDDFGPNVRMRIEKNKEYALTLKIKDENTLPEYDKENESNNVRNIVLDGKKEFKVNMDEMMCTCTRYQSTLIPCVHACTLTNEPYKFTSIVYSKENFLFEYDIKPVFESGIKEKVKYLKMLGRPKRKRKRDEDKENMP